MNEEHLTFEAEPEDPKPIPFDVTPHNKGLTKIYDHFKEELKNRQTEIEASQIRSEQKYFLNRLQNSFNLFNNNPYYQKKIDELYNIFSRKIPDYAKSQLRRLRRENISDDLLVDILQKLVDTARVRSFQEKEKESESMIIRTICSERFWGAFKISVP